MASAAAAGTRRPALGASGAGMAVTAGSRGNGSKRFSSSARLRQSRLLPADNIVDGAPAMAKTAAQHMVAGKTAKDGHLSVFPAAVEFTGIQPGTEYVATLFLQNGDTRGRRIRVVPPTAPGWIVEFTPTASVAPGLETKCTVRFFYPAGGLDATVPKLAGQTSTNSAAGAGDDDAEVPQVSTNGDIVDRLVVVSDDRIVEIPLRALQPAPRVSIEPQVPFGTVVVGRTHSRTLWMRNDGQRGTPWRIEYDSALPLRFEPASGHIEGDDSADDLDRDGRVSITEQAAARHVVPRVPIQVHFTAEQEGVFRALASLLIPGQPAVAIDVTSTVVDHSIEVVKPNNRGPLSAVAFGSIFFGHERTIRTVLVNNGPTEVTVSCRLARAPERGRADHSSSSSTLGARGGPATAGTSDSDGEDSDEGRVADPLAMARELMMKVSPRECVVPAYGEAEVSFTFCPEDTAKPAPFKVQAARLDARRRKRLAAGQVHDELRGAVALGGGLVQESSVLSASDNARSGAAAASVLVATARRSGRLGVPPGRKRRDPGALTLSGSAAGGRMASDGAAAAFRGGRDTDGKDGDDAGAMRANETLRAGLSAQGLDGDAEDEEDDDEDEIDGAMAAALAAPAPSQVVRAQAVLSCGDTGQRIVLPMAGTAVRPGLRVSRQNLFFGDCAVGDRRDVLITISNPSDTLDMAFAIANVANFQASPRSGKLGPLASQKVVVTYHPSEFGPHRKKVPISIAGGLQSVSLRVEGEALGVLPGGKRVVRRVAGAPPEAFETRHKFVPGDKSIKLKAEERKARHPLPWEPAGAAPDAETEEALAMADGELGGKLLGAVAEQGHKNSYVQYLRQSAASRTRLQRSREANRTGKTGAPRWDDPTSLGMPDPRDCLDEPDPGMPNADEPLWLAQPLDADGKPVPVPDAPALARADPLKPIKTKFKSGPATQAELKDCAAELSDEALAAVRASPATLDFGETNVRASVSRSFAVYNGSGQTVLIQLEQPEHAPEISSIRPRSQVVPNGKIAGFDVSFTPSGAGDFHERVTWSINKRHTMRFTVLAQVHPVDLQLSEQELRFRFEDGSDETVVSHELELRNPGQAPGEFQWRLPDATAFTIHPMHGIVAPNGGTCDVRVSFSPAKGLAHKSFAALLVRGGATSVPPPKLTLLGQAHGADLQLVKQEDRVLDIGDFAVGMPKEVSVALVNKGRTSAVFRLDKAASVVGASIDPAAGEVGAGDSLSVSVRLMAREERAFDPAVDVVSIGVRGADPVRVGVQARAVMPDVRVAEEVIDFGGVAVGGSARRRVTLHNRSVIPAEIVVELADFPEFTLAAPMGMDPDDAASVAGESVFQAESIAGESAAGGADGNEDASAGPDDDRNGADGDEGDDDADEDGTARASEVPVRFRLRVAAKAVLPLDLVFSPRREGSHTFVLPFNLVGAGPDTAVAVEAALRRSVCALGLRPRLRLSSTRVDFGHRVVHSDPARRVPYTVSITMTNTEEDELTWEADVASLVSKTGSSIFSWMPTSGVLAPGETDTIRVLFNPGLVRDYAARVPIYLNGDLQRARDAVAAVAHATAGAAGTGTLPGRLPGGLGILAGAETPTAGLGALTQNPAEAAAAQQRQAEEVAAAAAAVASTVPVNPYLFVEMHGAGIHPQLTFDMPELILQPVPLRTQAHGTFHVEGHGFDLLQLKYRVLSDSYPAKVPLKLYFPRGDVVSLARPRIPVHVVFESAVPLAFTTIVEFTDSDMNKYKMPVTGVADSSALTIAPFLAANRGEFDILAAPRLAPILTPAIRDTKRALVAAGLVLASGRPEAEAASAAASGAGAGPAAQGSTRQSRSGSRSGSRRRGQTAEDRDKKSASKSFVGQPPLAEDGEELPPHMREQQAAALGEATHVLRWLNASLFRTPVRNFPEDIVALHGRPVADMVSALSGKAVWDRAGDPLPANSRMRASVLYRRARELLTALKQAGAFVHTVRAEQLLPLQHYVHVRKAVTGATTFGGPAGAPMLPLTSPLDKLNRKRLLRKAYPAASLGAWMTVVLQSVKVFVLSRISLASLASLPGLDLRSDAAGLAALSKVEAAEAEAEAERERLRDEMRRGRHEKDPLQGADGARIRAMVAQVRRKAFAPDAMLTKSNMLSMHELVLARWASFHHNRAFPTLPRRVVDFHRDLRDGVVVIGILLSHCPFLAEDGWPLHDREIRRVPEGDGEYRQNWDAIAAALAQLQLTPPFVRELFLAGGARAVQGEGLMLRRVAEMQEAANKAEAKRIAAEAARAREARLLTSSRGSMRSSGSSRAGGDASAAAVAGAGAEATAAGSAPPAVPGGGRRGRTTGRRSQADDGAARGLPEGPVDAVTAAAVLASDDASRTDLARLQAQAAEELPPGIPPSAARDVRCLFDTGGILVNEGHAAQAGRVLPGEGCLRACMLAVLWLYRQLPGVVPCGKLEFACAVGKQSIKAIELSNPSDTPIAYTVALEPLGPPDDASVFSVAEHEVSLEAGAGLAYPVAALARYARPARARLTFRSRRQGVAPASSLVFELVTVVAARPPEQTIDATTPLYEPSTIVVPICNPFTKPGTFTIRLIPMPPDAPSGFNVPQCTTVDPTDLAAAEEAELEALTGGAAADGGIAAGDSPAGLLSSRSRSALPGGAASVALGRHRAKGAGKRQAQELRVGQWPGEAGEAGHMTGTGRWPAPYWCKIGSVSLKPGSTKKLPVQFLPFTLGPHACAVELSDARLGEVVFELRGTALPPAPIAVLQFSASMQEEVLRDLRVTPANPPLARALQLVLQRLDRAQQSMELAARDAKQRQAAERADRKEQRRAAKEAQRAVAQFQGRSEVSSTSLGGSSVLPSLPEFLVDVESPWWDVMEDSWRLADPPLPSWAAREEGKGRRRSVGRLGGDPTAASAAPGVARGSARGGAAASDVAGMPKGAAVEPGVASLEEPEGMRDPAALHVSLRPKAPGKYKTQLVMTSERETRVYVLVADVAPTPMRRELELRVPAGDSVTQTIPLVNASGETWTMRAAIEALGAARARPDAASYRAKTAPSGPAQHHFDCPAVVSLPPGSRKPLSLTFAPAEEGKEQVRLTVTNDTRPDMPPLILHVTGVATESAPLAELELRCKARERVVRTVQVPNNGARAARYEVEADLPFVSGKPALSVQPAARGVPGTAAYEVVMRPMVEGSFEGSITFRDPDTGASHWAALSLDVLPPEPEDTIRVEALVRQAVTISVELTNPLDEPAEFDADVRGKGLVGDPVLALGPGETKEYELLFSPLVPGNSKGSLTLSHPTAGELWYVIEMQAAQPEPEMLPPMHAPVGRRDRVPVMVENPTKHEATVRSVINNPRNFAVEPESFVLAPYSRHEVTVTYTPSAVGTEERATVRLVSDRVGEWVYLAEGTGSPPGVMGEDVLLVAPAGLSASTSIPFRNPFPEQLEVHAEIEMEKDEDEAGAASGRSSPATVGSVRLPPIRGAAGSAAASFAGPATSGPAVFELLKRPKAVVPPFAVTQIPIAFNPLAISEFRGSLLVHASTKGLTWTFPLRGVAEAPPSKRILRFRSKARESKVHDLELVLPGLRAEPGEEFRVELQAAAQVQETVAQAVTLEVVDTGGVRGPDDPIALRVHMHASKPFRARGQLIISKASGGRWRWETHLEAGEPDADDTIEVHSELGHRASVAISLTNSEPAYAPFKAAFALDAAAELAVSPAAGTLPPNSAPGETIVITFTPQEYGKVCHGRLVVETATDQWIYDVVGSQPRYHKPAATESKIDNRLDPVHTRTMRARAAERSGANFIRANAAAAARVKAPQSAAFRK